MATSGVFSGPQVVEMAVQTEQSGHAFYLAAAETARSDDVRKLLEWLAGQERLHEQTFKEMLQGQAADAPREEYSGQRSEFIQTLLDARVLPDAETGRAALAAMTDDLQAVEFALNFEKDTILFMYEMRALVSEAQAATVDKLIAEEKSHVQRLNEIKAQLA